MSSIEKLLEAQSIDRERLILINSVENGITKRNFDSANKLIANTKESLLALEAEARAILDNFARIGRVLEETVNTINREKSNAGGEDAGNFGSLLSRVSILEGQLADMERRIRDKTAAFDNARVAAAKATKIAQAGAEELVKLRAAIKGKVTELD
jgi:hypothetical protein